MLHELNAEGNQLKGMPMGALKLRNLVRLKVRTVTHFEIYMTYT